MGFSKSRSPNPTARSIARLGERCTPSVMVRLRRFPLMANKLTANTKPHTTGVDVGLAARMGGPQLSTRIRNCDVFQNSSGSAILRRSPAISPWSPGGVARPRTSCRDAMRYGLSSGKGISVPLVLSIAWNAAGASSRARLEVWPDLHRAESESAPPFLTMDPGFSNAALGPLAQYDVINIARRRFSASP